MIIDGRIGEGGGQILRSSLTLSMLTGQPFQIHHIRAKRTEPGLKQQHLTAVAASAAISGAEVRGSSLASQKLTFNPGRIKSGKYEFNIPTAGSASLVLQTIFFPLAHSSRESTVVVQGGTHVSWSPSYEYLTYQWLPMLKRLGYQAELSIQNRGYYPSGGGKITAHILPVDKVRSISVQGRGKLLQISGLSAVTNLPIEIAKRQRKRLVSRLGSRFPLTDIRVKQVPGRGKGTSISLLMKFDQENAAFTSLGERGKRAETVADEIIEEIIHHHQSASIWDPYLADQILIPLVGADRPSEMDQVCLTDHTLTNARIVNAFLPDRIEIEGEAGDLGKLIVTP